MKDITELLLLESKVRQPKALANIINKHTFGGDFNTLNYFATNDKYDDFLKYCKELNRNWRYDNKKSNCFNPDEIKYMFDNWDSFVKVCNDNYKK